MKMGQVQEKAQSLGIDAKKFKKTELIHAIQSAEHYTVCYGRSNGQCTQEHCCFRDDCLKLRL
jgi:hypothetical protein